MIKAIIFDLDGTLLNTIEDIRSVLNESLKKFFLPEISVSDTQKFVGNGAKRLVERAVGSRVDMADKIYNYYAERFAKCNNDNTGLYEGESEALTLFKDAGIKLAIITNKPHDATKAVYGRYLANFGFDEVLGQTEYYPLKPNPASTLAIMEKLGVNKDECVFVGDGETDVMTARSAGIKNVAVLWGYRTREQIVNAGAETFAENFGQLVSIIMK